MKKPVLVILSVLFALTSNAQKVQDTYTMSDTGKKYEVITDCMEAKYKDKDFLKKKYDQDVFLQVDVAEEGVKAYIQLSASDAKSFAKNLQKTYAKAKEWAAYTSINQKRAGSKECNLYFTRYDSTLEGTVYGRETGQDYEVFYKKNPSGDVKLLFKGESANNEGDIPFKLAGWKLVISSKEELQQIVNALLKASESL